MRNTNKSKQYGFVFFSPLHASGLKATEVSYPSIALASLLLKISPTSSVAIYIIDMIATGKTRNNI